MIKRGISIFLVFFFFCSLRGSSVLTVIDTETNKPIEGAVVYLLDQRYAFRSDVDGRVVIPAEGDSIHVTVQAKNYRPLELYLSLPAHNLQIKMFYDPELVNSVEKRLKFTRKDTLQGRYGQYRSNNNLLFYDLKIKIDVERHRVEGRNTIIYEMLRDADVIQIDLFKNLQIDQIVFQGDKLAYKREHNAVFIKFPQMLQKGSEYSIDFFYSGQPQERGRFGSMVFTRDSLGNPWVYTACQGTGSSVWWPGKDQHWDEVDSMAMHFIVPSGLTAVSNGKFMGKEDLDNGFFQYNWKVHYPINNYCVSVNIGKYVLFSDLLDDLELNYYVMPYHLKKAKKQFQQVKPMLKCYQKHFGEYPFKKDGYKLVEVPYSGMEHQSAVTYGNLFTNGYLGRDWTGVGISTKFDFIIIHESAHEWFGNSVTCGDYSDAWIHEGFGTYMESVYVEDMFGYEAALKYLNGYKRMVGNRAPVAGPPGVNHWPTQDIYFKGALFLNTLRHMVNDDQKWWNLLHELHQHFRYKVIFITDILNFFNDFLDRDLKPVFDQYLYYPDLPVLQVKEEENELKYRWKADVKDFNMTVKVRLQHELYVLHPSAEWESRSLPGLESGNWEIAGDLFYIKVEKIK